VSSLRELVTVATAGIENLTPAETAWEIDHGDVLLVDVREPFETADGVIPRAVCSPRGLLEFQADLASAHHQEPFIPQRRVIAYSSSGARSALAAATLQQLGYHDVAHLVGGFRAWLTAGLPVDAGAGDGPRDINCPPLS
jgi:rhodanese-related sulfurtransferase